MNYSGTRQLDASRRFSWTAGGPRGEIAAPHHPEKCHARPALSRRDPARTRKPTLRRRPASRDRGCRRSTAGAERRAAAQGTRLDGRAAGCRDRESTHGRDRRQGRQEAPGGSRQESAVRREHQSRSAGEGGSRPGGGEPPASGLRAGSREDRQRKHREEDVEGEQPAEWGSLHGSGRSGSRTERRPEGGRSLLTSGDVRRAAAHGGTQRPQGRVRHRVDLLHGIGQARGHHRLRHRTGEPRPRLPR